MGLLDDLGDIIKLLVAVIVIVILLYALVFIVHVFGQQPSVIQHERVFAVWLTASFE